MRIIDNNKDDYLWDGSGEPDPAIEELESILGTLRHKGEAPKLPARPANFYRSSSMLAIAASVLLALGVVSWITLHRHDNQIGERASINVSPVVVPPSNESATKATAANDSPGVVSNNEAQRRDPVKKLIRIVHHETDGMTLQEIKEGQEAKARLMMAMQVASVKLNEAKKRVQEDSHPVKS